MLPVETRSEMGIGDYARVLKRRRSTIALSAVILGVLASLYAFTAKPIYASTAQVLVRPSLAQTVLTPAASYVDPTVIPTDLQLFSSESVKSNVLKTLGSAPSVTPSQVGTTNVIAVGVNNGSAQTAAAIANAYAHAFVNVVQAQDQANLNTAVTRLNGQLESLATEITQAPPGSATQGSLAQQRSSLSQELAQLQLSASVAGSGTTISASATPDNSPVSPKKGRDIGLGVLAGAIIGCGVAFVREFLDDSVKTRQDIENLLGDGATIAVVPLVTNWDDPSAPVVVSLTDPKAPAAEAYRSLRTSIQFLRLDGEINSLQITSPRAGEGKTTTVVNLAVAMAKTGQRVALMSCDLRRPRLHSFFGMDNDVGFTSIAGGDATLAEAAKPAPFDERILVLPSGPVPPNPAELLAGRLTRQIIAELGAMVDVVLIDSPPTLPVTDASVLARHVDGTLVVATAGSTSKKDLSQTVDALRQVEAQLIGTVLNAATTNDRYEGYGYGYGYGYGDAANPENAAVPSRQRPAVQVLRRRAPLIGVATILAALIGGSLSNAGVHYVATATVNPQGALGQAPNSASVSGLAKTRSVLSNGISTAGLQRPPSTVAKSVTAKIDARSGLITLSVADANPTVAKDLATGIAQSLAKSLQSRTAPFGIPPAVTTPAGIPTRPQGGHAVLNAGLGGVIGFLLSAAVFGALERKRQRIRSAEDLQRRLGLRVIGSLSLAPHGVHQDA